MRELTNYQSILQKKSEVAEGYFCKYPDLAVDEVKLYRDINNSKVKSALPEIMFYGIYNAGKSSTLNELMGADRAKVSDIPETAVITPYPWHGYYLTDTPGIGAPEEHEKITQAHLKKADIVLFFMSTSGGYELEKNYSRMKDIVNAGKKIIIVLNDKDGYMCINDDDAENLQEIRQKIHANIENTGINGDEFCIVIVNADMAREGRVTNDPELIEMSNIGELKKVILTELKKTSPFDVLRRSIVQMEECLEKFADEAKKQEDSKVFTSANQVLEDIYAKRRVIDNDVNNYIERKTTQSQLAYVMASDIWANREDQDALGKAVTEKLDALYKGIEKYTQEQLEEALGELSEQLDSFVDVKLDHDGTDAEIFKSIKANLNKLKNELAVVMSMDKDSQSDKGGFNFRDIICYANAAEAAGGLLTESGKSVATNLAKTSIGKAFSGTTVGKMLGSATSSFMPPLPGPVPPVPWPIIIEIGRRIFDYMDSDNKRKEEEARQRNEAEKRRLELEKQARQEINQKCLYWVDNLADELKSAANQAIKETLSTYEAPFRKELEKCREQGAERMNDVAALRSLCNEYHQLLVELGGN